VGWDWRIVNPPPIVEYAAMSPHSAVVTNSPSSVGVTLPGVLLPCVPFCWSNGETVAAPEYAAATRDATHNVPRALNVWPAPTVGLLA
jgi:hypothetical protein